jgi:transcriptional antiterminator NusG
MAMRWYVVHAYSGYEKRVANSIREQVEFKGMQDFFGEILVPTESVVEMREGKKRKSERKFYPGYVLVHMDMNDDSWHLVKSTPRVMGFIGGTAEKPAPITAKEADTILSRVRDGAEKPTQKTIFEPGQMVRVVDGPFADFTGSVEKVNYDKSRLQVSVSIFGRATPVELEFTQVEKA